MALSTSYDRVLARALVAEVRRLRADLDEVRADLDSAMLQAESASMRASRARQEAKEQEIARDKAERETRDRMYAIEDAQKALDRTLRDPYADDWRREDARRKLQRAVDYGY